MRALATQIILKIVLNLKDVSLNKSVSLNGQQLDTRIHETTSNILYGAPVFVYCTSLLAHLCVSRALQLTVAFGTALFTTGSVAFQTTSSTRTALITSVSLTDN